MIERGDDTRLRAETLGESLIAELDGNLALEPAIARPIYSAHAPRSNWHENFVRAKPVACGGSHTRQTSVSRRHAKGPNEWNGLPAGNLRGFDVLTGSA